MAAAKVSRDRDESPEESHDTARPVGLVGRAAERAVGDVEQQDPEGVDDDLHPSDQCHPADDRCHERIAPPIPITSTRPRSSDGTKK